MRHLCARRERRRCDAELHDEADYFFGLDNNLIALGSDEGTLVETNKEMEDEDTYCYNCGHEHDNPSHGSWPEPGCDDYEEPTKGMMQ